MYDTTLSQKYAKDLGAMQKENKRCIPKEGMPHASACQKKRIKDAYPKKVCHMLRHVKKERERNSPLTKKKEKGRDGAYNGVRTPSTKNIHTLAHIDRSL